MSVYNAYVAPSAPAPSYYSQAPHSNRPFHQPHQQQQQQFPGYYPPPPHDENGFRSMFSQRLGALTVNSRPIIQDLSLIAQNNPHMARIVVECIEHQINMSPPPFKLPLFYLLDSIAKNAFDPYAAAFRDTIFVLFMKAYDAVDQQTKHKMREMVVTWRNGAPNQRELFGPHVQSQLEQRVWGSTVRRLFPRSPPRSLKRLSSVQRVPTATQVLTELDVVLVQKERAAQQNPYDELLPRHINALHELRRMVPTMNADDLAATLTRLREMARASVAPAQPPPAPPAMPPSAPYGHPPQFPLMPPQMQYGYPPPVPQYPTVQPPPSVVPSVNPALPTLNAQNIISLLSSITSLQGGKITPEVPVPSLPTQVEITASTSIEDYEKAILARKIKLTSNDIVKTVPQVLPFLYVKDSPQCNECGMRFPAGEDGKAKLRGHLDQHFRQNTKANEVVGRGYSRSWFVGKKNWVEDIPDHPLNNGKRPLSKMTDKQKAEMEEATRKELEAKFVIVPPGEEGRELRCAICTEAIKVEFKEADEDWVWQNAVKVDGKIYHATCHHDWSMSTFNRLRLDAGKGSRQVTPEFRGTEGTPQRIKSDSPRTPPARLSALAGTKRKAAASAESGSKPASLSSKEGTPILKTEDGEPRIKRRAIQA